MLSLRIFSRNFNRSKFFILFLCVENQAFRKKLKNNSLFSCVYQIYGVYLYQKLKHKDMKIQTKIGYGKVTITEPMIDDVYQIEENEETNKFYVWSENGYNTMGIVEYADLDKAIQHVKKTIKTYFLDRGEENPKGF